VNASEQEREESLQALQEDLWESERKDNLLEIRDEERKGQDTSSERTVSIQEKTEEIDLKFQPNAEDGVVWCPRCDSEMMIVHSSYYCSNCKYKAGCCG
jgi:hypothetical protein